jgi:beta-glucanase (GH16 family)
MHAIRNLIASIAILHCLLLGSAGAADGPAAAGKALLDVTPGNASLAKCLAPSSVQVTADASKDPAATGVLVTIQPGKDNYPGLAIKPDGGAPWDLSACGHIDVRVTNLGAKPLALTLRVDNAGDWRQGPWNTEQSTLKPGETGTVTTIFGYSYGHKPGFKLNPAKVTQVLVFATKSDDVRSFRIESLTAAGPAGEAPPVDPKSIRVKPAGGVLLGAGTVIDAEKQIDAVSAKASFAAGEKPSIQITFDGGKNEPRFTLKPAVGRWDLRDAIEIRVRLRNTGTAPLTPRVRLDCGGAPSDWVQAPDPLSPGAQQELTIHFAGLVPWRAIKNSGDRTSWNGEPNTGSRITSDAVSAVVISADHPAAGATLTVDSIVAGLEADMKLPEWLGKRPPVEGDWVKTFDDEFDGAAIDLTKWNVQGPNYYDKKSHWSKDNVIVGGGVAKLHYEKKTGRHNDNPIEKISDYASGYLDTLGKWTQRYGYFEARMKLPRSPGLWPAMWLMPDRGANAGPQWMRQDTGNGGMEFDVMEHLTRWGPYRYNIAMHWDGYGKNHKQTGTEKIYLQPDKDGWIVSGILWTPGVMVIYGNGHEVARWEDPRISSVPSDLMFTLPMGGWDNDALDDSRLPADFEIDYVRAWQRRDLVEAPAAR